MIKCLYGGRIQYFGIITHKSSIIHYYELDWNVTSHVILFGLIGYLM